MRFYRRLEIIRRLHECEYWIFQIIMVWDDPDALEWTIEKTMDIVYSLFTYLRDGDNCEEE